MRIFMAMKMGPTGDRAGTCRDLMCLKEIPQIFAGRSSGRYGGVDGAALTERC